ncbi:uncharacterized protein SCHCODRAFT_02628192 [Schizophyllum commune H4-8]|uniref:uncharacterized protein n=1 Tax=Schizophyllum commune (strain H4-8 / FGSC 9210) TaxID=578458 RepID=UPI00215DEF13|nr:uncharacterized protein SCHCODRAFT_02628192 [Schizophyllum commune H4-8]KAI5891140.1 hypothetical protein SCHCODRAFT_02628192 [Schizophyllum commune H4-8]
MSGLAVVGRAIYPMVQPTTAAATQLPYSVRRAAVFLTLISEAHELFLKEYTDACLRESPSDAKSQW